GQIPEQKSAETGAASASAVSGKVADASLPVGNVLVNAETAAEEPAQISSAGSVDEAIDPSELNTAPGNGKAKTGPQVAPVAQEAVNNVQGEAATAVTAAGARTPAASNASASTGEAGAGAGAGQVQAQTQTQARAATLPSSAGSEVLISSEPGAEEPVLSSGKQVSDAGPDVSDAAKRDHPAGADTSLERPGQPAGKGAGNAAPIVNAFLASQMMADDSEVSTSLTEVSVTGEGAATVRGGDLTGAARTESLQTPTQAQSGQVATQVAAEIARNLKNGQTKFQMRFDPPELGRVEVNMKVASDGSVQAHLIVERPETLDMFLRDQRGLERALEAAGLNANSNDLQFSLKQEGGGEFASGEGASDQSSGEARTEGDSDGVEGDPVDEDIIRLTLAEQRGGLDLKV
ncbi:MAG: flagellar hook-length control protein FliK, partial [Pseudomonadota bacterium]